MLLMPLKMSPASDSMTEKRRIYGSIGSSIGNDRIAIPGKYFKWPKSKLKALGLWISIDPEISASLNFKEELEKERKILDCWSYRTLGNLARENH